MKKTMLIKEKSIQEFFSKFLVRDTLIGVSMDERPFSSKGEEVSIHGVLSAHHRTFYLKKECGLNTGDDVKFELTDCAVNTGNELHVSFTYNVRKYDSLTLKLVLLEYLIDPIYKEIGTKTQ